MARIAGVDLPREKRVQVGLTYVYGIGQTTANKILEATGINPDTRVKDLTLEEEAKIRDYIDQANIIVEGDLRRNVALDIKREHQDKIIPWLRSSLSVALAIARICPAAASAPRPMHVPARARSALSLTRRSKEDLRNGKCK